MKNSTRFYPDLEVNAAGTGIVSQAGAVLVAETAKAVGLPAALSAALAPWRRPFAVHNPVHNPGKILLDQVLSLATGRVALANVGPLRSQPGVFGSVASDPTVSRLVARLAQDAPAVLTAINTVRAQVRSRVWKAAGVDAPAHSHTPGPSRTLW